MRKRANSADPAPRSPRARPVNASPPHSWQAVQRLLAIRLDNIGDLIMLTPALRALRRALPYAQLELMASPAGSQVASLLPWIDGVFVHRAVWQDISGSPTPDLSGQRELIERLRQGRFDAAVIFTSFLQSPYPPAYACYLAGIPVRVGQSREFGGRILSHWIKPLPDDVHQVDRNLHLLESIGLQPAGRALELHVPQRDRRAVDALLEEAGLGADEPFVALVPGASCPARRYAPARFAEVARRLLRESGLRVVILGAPKEADLVRPILDAVEGPSAISLVGRTTIPMLAELIRRARLVVANNSAAMHLADAFVRPAVILFAGTEREEQWRPRRAPVRLLRRPTGCSPCYGLTCPYHLECLDIPALEVVAAALEVLAQTEQQATERIEIGGQG